MWAYVELVVVDSRQAVVLQLEGRRGTQALLISRPTTLIYFYMSLRLGRDHFYLGITVGSGLWLRGRFSVGPVK